MKVYVITGVNEDMLAQDEPSGQVDAVLTIGSVFSTREAAMAACQRETDELLGEMVPGVEVRLDWKEEAPGHWRAYVEELSSRYSVSEKEVLR